MRKDLKRRARGLLYGNYKTLTLVTLVTSALNLVLLFVLRQAFPSTDSILTLLLNLACSVLINIVCYLLLAGVHLIYLRLCRGIPFKMADLFSAFVRQPEQPAIVSVLQYAIQTVCINVCYWSLFEQIAADSITKVLSFLVLEIAVLCLMVWVDLGFSMVLFLYCDDPWKTAKQLIQESWRLINKKRWSLFCLNVSFAGMYLLGILSLGIGILFVQPYYYTTKTLFYLKLREAE